MRARPVDIDPSQRPIEYARLRRGKSTLLSVKPCSCMAAVANTYSHTCTNISKAGKRKNLSGSSGPVILSCSGAATRFTAHPPGRLQFHRSRRIGARDLPKCVCLCTARCELKNIPAAPAPGHTRRDGCIWDNTTRAGRDQGYVWHRPEESTNVMARKAHCACRCSNAS